MYRKGQTAQPCLRDFVILTDLNGPFSRYVYCDISIVSPSIATEKPASTVVDSGVVLP